MIVPNEIQIGAHKITVEYVKQEVADAKAGVGVGYWDPVNRNMIVRETNGQKDLAGETFVHEVIEAANDICDLQMNHLQISVLGNLMYQAFESGSVQFGTN